MEPKSIENAYRKNDEKMMRARMALRSHMDQKMLQKCSHWVVKLSVPEADWPIWVRVSLGEPSYGGSEEDLTRRTAVLRTGAADSIEFLVLETGHGTRQRN